MPMDIPDETVIVADNDSMMRGLLRTALERPRRILMLCADGAEAVATAEECAATLVLLDMRMPRMDGLAACRAIRALPGYGAVPILVLTAFDDRDSRDRALRAGATSFMVKPFSRDRLIGEIGPLIAARKTSLELEYY